MRFNRTKAVLSVFAIVILFAIMMIGRNQKKSPIANANIDINFETEKDQQTEPHTSAIVKVDSQQNKEIVKGVNQDAAKDTTVASVSASDADFFEAKRKELEDAIRKHPKDWSRYELLGDLFIQQGLPHDAIKIAKDCHNVDPYAPYCSEIIIKAYEVLGDEKALVAAIQDCRKMRGGDFFCIQKARDYLLAQGDV